MEIETYIQQKKELYSPLIDFIESSDDSDIEYTSLINEIEKQSIVNNNSEVRELLQLISKITDNHHRDPSFFPKLERLLTHIIIEKKAQISSNEIIQIFESNKRVLYLLFEKRIVIPDSTIMNLLLTKKDENGFYFYRYLFPSIKKFIEDEKRRDFIQSEILKELDQTYESYEKKCQLGENDSIICTLIRQDSIEEFVQYTTQSNLSLNLKIKPSLFETNSFLLKNKETSLIEYAAFFGSIQIFQYLKYNKIELTSSLWQFAIHSNNPELIHILEECNVDTDVKNFAENYLEEAIKCHHNDFVNYIRDYVVRNEVEFFFKIDFDFDKNFFKNIFYYRNYLFFPDDLKHKFAPFYACMYSYLDILKLYSKQKDVDFNSKIIFFFNCFKLCFYLLILFVHRVQFIQYFEYNYK